MIFVLDVGSGESSGGGSVGVLGVAKAVVIGRQQKSTLSRTT